MFIIIDIEYIKIYVFYFLYLLVYVVISFFLYGLILICIWEYLVRFIVIFLLKVFIVVYSYVFMFFV